MLYFTVRQVERQRIRYSRAVYSECKDDVWQAVLSCVCFTMQILALYDAFDSISVDSVVQYVSSLQQSDGCFYGDKWGEVDTRFSFCAVACLALLVRYIAYVLYKLSTAVHFCILYLSFYLLDVSD